MDNLADIIERWILERISNQQNQIIILRRNEIAGVLNCAPSQISYVLNTRFTLNRGFLVESRRGLGGFIRIARIPFLSIVYEDTAGKIDENMSLVQMNSLLEHLKNNNLLTDREAAILTRCAGIIYEQAEPCERSKLLKSLLLSLSENS